MNFFILLSAFLSLIAGNSGSKPAGDLVPGETHNDGKKNSHDSHDNNPKQDHHKDGHGDKHGNGHGNKDDKGHGNKDDKGHGDNHLPAPDSEDSEECDVEYLFSENGTETERCSDGKEFFYTDRYKNETFCSNSAEIDREKCWWDTSIGSNCLESSECVWLTNRVEQGMCYCSHASRCKACKHQTPAPTINRASTLCPDNCEVYYLGCVGMYCKCWGECTSSVEAGCSEPVNAGCHSYFFGEEIQGDDRKVGKGHIIPNMNKHKGKGKGVADKIVDFVDEYGEGRYEIFGDFAYEYRNGLLNRIISTDLMDLENIIGSGSDENDWLDDLITGQWLHDLINGEEDESEEDDDNDWTWPWFDKEDESEDDDDNDWTWPWFSEEDESEEDDDIKWPWSGFGR